MRASVRHGQLQAMEPIIIVMVIAVIIGIVLVFYFRITTVSSGISSQRLQSQEDVLSMIRIARMPELLCPGSISGDTNCIDLEKAKAFSAILRNQTYKTYYHPILGNANITIFWLDGDMKTHQMQLYSDIPSNSTHTSASLTYFTVYDPIAEVNDLAWVMIQKEVVS